MRTFSDYLRKREHAEDATDHDNQDGDREATRQKMIQIAKVVCHKHPKIMLGLLDKVAQQDAEIRSAVDDLKRNMKGSSIGNDQGLGDMANGQDEIAPNAADSHGGDGDGGDGGM